MLTCPNRHCSASLPYTYEQPECPECGTYLYPARPVGESERLTDRPRPAARRRGGDRRSTYWKEKR